MIQYSIYIKVLSGTDACEKYYKSIELNLPHKGKVDILTITDKQYENIHSFVSSRKNQRKNESKQYLLF
jgi:CRISPR-associated protein Cas2